MENKEQYQQMIDEAYENYVKKMNEDFISSDVSLPPAYYPVYKDVFVEQIKTDEVFAKKWGLKIEERELSLEERHELALPIWKEKYGPLADIMVPTNVDNTPYKIPRKLITVVTYRDTTIEVYE